MREYRVGWMLNKDPCYNCEKRAVGCHATCEGYLSWKEEIRKQKEIMQGEAETRIKLNEMQAIRSNRIARRKHRTRRK